MANGIKDLNTEEQEIKDSNLGLTGDITGGQDTGDLDGNLFLSPKEQRGLEAATFATVIGQAPTTGNLIGDFFSTLAQTGPASLATYKEKQNIKEKEAEYKSKKASLASKIKFLDVYDTSSGALVYRRVPETEVIADQTQNPDNPRYIKYFSMGDNKTEFIYNGPGPTNGMPVNVGLNYALATNELDKANNRRLTYTPVEEVTVYYDMKELSNKNMDKVKRPLTRREYNSLPEKERANLTSEEPASYAPLVNEFSKTIEGKVTERNKIKKRLSAATELINYRNSVYENLTKGGKGGEAGRLVLGLDGFKGFVQNGFDALKTSVFGGGTRTEKQIEDMVQQDIKNFGGTDAILEHLEKKNNSGLAMTSAERQVFDYLSGNMSEADEQAVATQGLTAAVTQLVYMVAKTRESGGKFSVPDIEFAFRSIGNSSNPKILMAGIDEVVNKTIMGVVNDTKNAYYDPVNDVRREPIDLYELGDLHAYKNVFLYNQIENYNPIDALPVDLQQRWNAGSSGSPTKTGAPDDPPAGDKPITMEDFE
jgi:hypothetical protein|tara:strand:+ start:92 stop:1702 length:1611 start_codon:yes stop_codon:yes gene_type:complete